MTLKCFNYSANVCRIDLIFISLKGDGKIVGGEDNSRGIHNVLRCDPTVF